MDEENPVVALYAVMCGERLNVDVIFVDTDEGVPIINCRFREWKKGNATDRMILAGGRSLDEALVYAYRGLVDNVWLPMDWSARSYNVGVVNMLARPHLPVRQPIAIDSVLRAVNSGHMTTGPQPVDSVRQNGAQSRRGQSKEE